VKRYDILDTPPEEAFDRIAAFAADLFSAPIALISFVGQDRVYFKSHHGLPDTDVSRGPGVSTSALGPWLQLRFEHGFHTGAPLRTRDGYELGKLSVIDHRPRRVDEQQIRRLRSLATIVMDRLDLRLSAREAATRAEVLSNEVDHRAMNSLQLIASLLSLQSRAASSPATAHQLSAAANRVLAVARVHRSFSADEALSHVPVVANLRELCGELSDILAIDIKVEGLEASVPKTQILAIGLIVNELVTNAGKHGGGQIAVTFRSTPDGWHELLVVDHGKGLPEGFTVDRSEGNGIGMKVVTALVTQLNGKLSARCNPVDHAGGSGSCFTVAFPAA
jgi:two-component sensor histidine kinase